MLAWHNSAVERKHESGARSRRGSVDGVCHIDEVAQALGNSACGSVTPSSRRVKLPYDRAKQPQGGVMDKETHSEGKEAAFQEKQQREQKARERKEQREREEEELEERKQIREEELEERKQIRQEEREERKREREKARGQQESSS